MTLKLGVEQGRAGWVQQTYITDDTEALSAKALQAAVDAGARFAKEATKFDHLVSKIGDTMAGVFLQTPLDTMRHVLRSKFWTNLLIARFAGLVQNAAVDRLWWSLNRERLGRG